MNAIACVCTCLNAWLCSCVNSRLHVLTYRVGGEEGGSIVISVSFVCSTGGRSGCVLLASTSIQKAMVLAMLSNGTGTIIDYIIVQIIQYSNICKPI